MSWDFTISAFDEPETPLLTAKAGAVLLAKPFSGRLLLGIVQRIHHARGSGVVAPAALDASE